MNLKISSLASDMHRLNSFARATNAYVQDRFAQLIDICWPCAKEVEELDEESVTAAKQRLMAVRKAFYEDWKQDKTLDLLRVLAAGAANNKVDKNEGIIENEGKRETPEPVLMNDNMAPTMENMTYSTPAQEEKQSESCSNNSPAPMDVDV
jgi:hypothetical protein